MSGFITRRTSEAPEGVKLAPLAKVVSAQPVLTDELLQLATAVAERYAGNVSDVLRAAIPARVAKVDKEFAARESEPVAPAAAPADAAGLSEPSPGAAEAYAGYEGAGDFLAQLAAGAAPRAVLASHKSYGPASWAAQVAHAVTSVRQSGRGAVVVVPMRRTWPAWKRSCSRCWARTSTCG